MKFHIDKEMNKVISAAVGRGWTYKAGMKGAHNKAFCPCGQHIVTISGTGGNGAPMKVAADMKRTGC